MSLGHLPEWGMFVVLGWPALVGLPMVLTEAMMQGRKDANKKDR